MTGAAISETSSTNEFKKADTSVQVERLAAQADLLPLWAGQSASLSDCTNVSAFLTSLVKEASEIAEPIIQWGASRRHKQILK